MGLFSSGSEKVEITKAEIALSKQGAQKFNDRMENFVPMEDSFIASLAPTAGERAAVAATGIADVQMASKGADAAIVKKSGDQGGSGKSIMARAGLANDRATAVGEAITGGDLALRNREITGMTKMAAFGRGLQAEGSVSLRSAASSAAGSAISKMNQKVTDRGTLMSGIGTAAGTFIGNYDTIQAIKKGGEEEPTSGI